MTTIINLGKEFTAVPIGRYLKDGAHSAGNQNGGPESRVETE